jgi:cytidylate kinase
MTTRVITVARQVGAAGDEIAQAIAERMRFRYIDYQVIQEAAREAGVSPETVSEAEHVPSLMTRLLEALARNPSMPVTAWADPVPLTSNPLFTSADYRRFIEDVIRDVSRQGDCVILGHAAQIILGGRRDTLRVLVTGSSPHRVEWLKAHLGVDEKEALRTIERTDNERRDYFRRFYEATFLAPWIYDLCLNSDFLEPAQAAELVAFAASQR